MVYEIECLMFGHCQDNIIIVVITDLTRQLFGWWYDYLSNSQRHSILAAIKKDENDDPILDENGREQGDQITFILNVIEYFVGEIRDMSQKNKEQLMNLKYHTLTDFR